MLESNDFDTTSASIPNEAMLGDVESGKVHPFHQRDQKLLLPNYYRRRSHDLVTHRDNRGLLMAILTLLLTIVVCILFICGLLLVDSYSAYQNWRASPSERSDDDSIHVVDYELPRINYTALFNEMTQGYPPDNVAVVQRRLRLINCVHSQRLRVIESVGSGWTKAVYRAQLDDGTPVALKTVSTVGTDVTRCRASGTPAHDCYIRSVRKFLHEVWLMLNFQHPNIVKMIGVCIPEDPSTSYHILYSIVELGETVDLIRLLQMSWDERLRIFYDLTNLLTFLARTRLGSMVLDDFRRQQFVLINGQLKLTDLDDLHAHHRPCSHHDQCTIDGKFTSELGTDRSKLKSLRGRCVAGFCDQWNERMNLNRNYIQFGSFLLSHGYPERVDRLIQTYKQSSLQGNISLLQLQTITNKIVETYKSGRQIFHAKKSNSTSGYIAMKDTDASPPDSIWCAQNYGCRLTVFDLQEAEDACSVFRDCYGFVLGKEKSWLNHSIVYLKTKQSRPISNIGHTLYLKTIVNEGHDN